MKQIDFKECVIIVSSVICCGVYIATISYLIYSLIGG